MNRQACAIFGTLLILPVLSAGCADSEADGYKEITASVESLPTTAEIQGDSGDPQVKPVEPVTSESTDVADTGTSTEVASATDADQGAENAPATAASPAADAPPSETPSEPEPGGESEVTSVPDATPGADDKPAPEKPQREIKLLIPSKTFKVEGPETALRVSFDDVDLLKVLNMDPVVPKAPELMPDWLKQLDGKRVRIRGFMYPPFSETDIRAFTLARDTEICCFGRNPLPYDLIDVFLREGVKTDYIDLRPFDVVGVFHIGEEIEPGYLYSIDDAIVIQ
ncbi:MAG: hypothetical protein ACYTGL_04345 [Planctomycetota bacterium]|jgi:hypothetical protein